MAKFKVWLRPMGNSCKVRVENGEGAQALRQKLAENGMECTDAKPLTGSAACVFHTRGAISEAKMEEIVSGIPDAQLMLDPA